MKRRQLLRRSALFALSGMATVGSYGWAARVAAQSSAGNKRLIVVLLRGAVDGLNVVVPHQASEYYEARPTIAIAPPRETNGALDLNGQFGLHPALAPLMPYWQAGSLAFVHASGSPDPSRSHFEAQYFMESGTPGVKTTPDGWLNRLLTVLPQTTPVRAVNFGETTPQILQGSAPVANLAIGDQANRYIQLDRPRVYEAFDQLYAGQSQISLAYQEGRRARDLIVSEFEAEMQAAAQGAPTPTNFSNDARRLTQLMAGDAQTQIAFMALGGWDTHVNQGSAEGQLAARLGPLGQGLATLVDTLGPLYKDTVVLVMSEFGRTVVENGNRGTDHGHGNVMWLLGGALQGKQVYGSWPGLDPTQLYEGRDLAITTDFRDIISSVLSQHMGLSSAQIAQVFPGYSPTRTLPLL